MSLAAPRNISPLIRLGRWTALLGGVYYGHTKLQRLKEYDAPLREKEIQKVTEEHHKMERENKRLAEESMASLAQAAGVGKK